MANGTSQKRNAGRLSPEGLAVLNACAISPVRQCYGNAADDELGCMYVSELVRLSPARLAVARASLSRTLRRLWRAGCVELINQNGSSLTAWHAAIAADLHDAEAQSRRNLRPRL